MASRSDPPTSRPVCVIDDEEVVRRSLEDLLRSAGRDAEAFASGAAFLAAVQERKVDASCLILDVNMPGLDGLELQRRLREADVAVPIIFVTGHGDIASSVRAMRAGAFEFLTKPFDPDALLESVERALASSASSGRTSPRGTSTGIIGAARGLERVFEDIETVAGTPTTVLIGGETGTGKELVAEALHARSGRKGQLVKVNCAAVPANLLESELMGHERGSFTGAVARRVGKFEAAHEGTIFLDEIGELPLELQPKLLRLLQEKTFERLGGDRPVRTTARVIAATNRDLRAMSAQRTFREDLFYRLNVFPIRLPALRERREDIPALVAHFIGQFAAQTGRRIAPVSDETMRGLVAYDWPGNVRELMNAIERGVLCARDGVLRVDLTQRQERCDGGAGDTQTPSSRPVMVTAQGSETLDELQRRHILSVLEMTNWIVGGPRGAAARLGIKRPTLLYRMKKLGIERDRSA